MPQPAPGREGQRLRRRRVIRARPRPQDRVPRLPAHRPEPDRDRRRALITFTSRAEGTTRPTARTAGAAQTTARCRRARCRRAREKPGRDPPRRARSMVWRSQRIRWVPADGTNDSTSSSRVVCSWHAAPSRVARAKRWTVASMPPPVETAWGVHGSARFGCPYEAAPSASSSAISAAAATPSAASTIRPRAVVMGSLASAAAGSGSAPAPPAPRTAAATAGSCE